MSDILPIDREVLESVTNEPEPTESNIKMEVAEPQEQAEQSEPANEVEEQTKGEDQCFEKPNKAKKKDFNELEFTAKGKPRKRKMTEKQLENLRKAQEKSVARRREQKAAKELEKAEKLAQKELEMEAKLEKKMEKEVRMKMQAKMNLEAKETARKAETWDEDRLNLLMERTIDNYITKKRAMKPKPREVIPPPQQPAPYQYQPPPPRQPPQHFQMGGNQYQGHSLDDPLQRLFGNY